MFQDASGAYTTPLALFSATRSSWRGTRTSGCFRKKHGGEVMTELLGPTPSRPTPPVFFLFPASTGAYTGTLALSSATRSSWRGTRTSGCFRKKHGGEVMTELLGPTPSRPTPPVFFLFPASTGAYTGTLALSSTTRSSKSARTSASKACVYLPACTNKIAHSHVLKFHPISIPSPHVSSKGS